MRYFITCLLVLVSSPAWSQAPSTSPPAPYQTAATEHAPAWAQTRASHVTREGLLQVQLDRGRRTEALVGAVDLSCRLTDEMASLWRFKEKASSRDDLVVIQRARKTAWKQQERIHNLVETLRYLERH